MQANKIVVFDLDETLGCFVEMGMFWDAINHVLGPQEPLHFNKILDIFPEFFRPNIINILKYLSNKKKDGSCQHIMIYTNNQGPRSWANMIATYFDYRIGEPIFDNIIAAFKVRGQQVELNRTSNDKSIGDLIRCTKIPKTTQICFVDDQYHPLMEDSNVYYINIKPYYYSMSYQTMAERYYNSFPQTLRRHVFIYRILDYMNKYTYDVIAKSKVESDIDKIVSKQIINHLDDFFRHSRSPTVKPKHK